MGKNTAVSSRGLFYLLYPSPFLQKRPFYGSQNNNLWIEANTWPQEYVTQVTSADLTNRRSAVCARRHKVYYLTNLPEY
jgi:hypothetical protein